MSGQDGELRRSIKQRCSARGERVTAVVYTNKKHAPYVELGTGPKEKQIMQDFHLWRLPPTFEALVDS